MNLYESLLYKKINGGTANPNRVQTIIGTVANPWGDVNYSELAEAIENNNANAEIIFTLGEEIGKAAVFGLDGRIWAFTFTSSTNTVTGEVDNLQIGSADWNTTGELNSLEMIQGNSSGVQAISMNEMASQMPSTLTIIWHPLPN